MSQTSALRDLDADIAAALVDAGLADVATYTPPGGGSAVPCTVYVDRDVQVYGDDQMPVGAPRTLITIFRSDVDAPARLGTVTLTETAETFKLDEVLKKDESRQQWACANG